FRNGILKGFFVDQYGSKKYVGPQALALYAASTGGAVFLNENFVHAGVGIKQNWNKYWASIYFIDEVEMLFQAVKELGYSFVKYKQIVNNMKDKQYRVNMDYLSLVLGRRGLSWMKIIKIYGLSFLMVNLLISPFMIIKNLKFATSLKSILR
ncbi:MAG: hypothetical protein V4658_10355, partial [Bacteroidota bacterium]